MSKVFAVFLLTALSTPALAEDFHFQLYGAHADSRISLSGEKDTSFARRALGLGGKIGMHANPRLLFTFAFEKLLYSDLDQRTNFSDDTFAVASEYEFIRVDRLAGFVNSGLSWHQLDIADDSSASYSAVIYDAAHNLNFDFGIGVRLGLTDSVEMTAEYKHSSTLLPGDATVRRQGFADESIEVGEIRDISIQSHVFLLGVGVKG